MDVNNAYTNATLEEPIYMKQPQGYIQKGDDYVLKLKKAMYELKQSSRAWYKCLSSALTKLGFQKPNSDTAVFYRHGEKGFAIIAVTILHLKMQFYERSKKIS